MRGQTRRMPLVVIGMVWAMFVAALGVLLPVRSVTASTTILYVDASRPDDGGAGTSWLSAKQTVQAALVLAGTPVNPATVQIWVADGTYYPDEGAGQTNNTRGSTFALKNNVAIYGGFAGNETLLTQRDPAANVTILSGDLDQSGTFTSADAYHVVISNANNPTALLDGFTITGGNADAGDNNDNNPQNHGGGISVFGASQAHFANLTISGNRAVLRGGGISNMASSAVFRNSVVSGNEGGISSRGGGVYNEGGSPSFTNVTISENRALLDGGGVFNNTSPASFTNVTISGNSAGFGGGGVHNVQSNPNFTNVTISGNRTDFFGGGVHNFQSNPNFTNTTIIGNHASFGGGGVYNYASNATFTNVSISGNRADNAGGGVYNHSGTPNFANSIIWGNSSEVALDSGAPTPIYAYSVVQGETLIGTGNLDGTLPANNPLFINPIAATSAPTTTGTYHLHVTSPAIDAAHPTSGPATDRDGLSRPNDGDSDGTARRDMGAYEAGQMMCGVAPNTTYTFDTNGGVIITTTATLNNLACLYVDMVNENHPTATATIKTGRYWAIHGLQSSTGAAATGFSGVSVTLPTLFTPDANDALCRYDGAGWNCAADAFHTTNKTITRNGVTAFSDWAVENEVGPTVVDFTATREANGVRLNWTTGSQLNTAGFRLNRGLTNDPADATPLVAAGFIPIAGEVSGAMYTYLDRDAAPEQTYFYWLVEVPRDGPEVRYGPVRVEAIDSYQILLPLVRR